MQTKEKIAIIGSGISGLSAAYFLKDHYDITLYEEEDRVGGHSRTIKVPGTSVDTGFIVLNDRTYPNLLDLFEQLDIEIVKTEMSFSISVDKGQLEWSGGSLDTMFAQRKNIFNPYMLKGIWDILKFNKQALKFVSDFPNITLKELIKLMSLGEWFQDYYIIPMGGAIWSCSYEQMMNFPASSFVNFFHNHGLLTINDRPTWYTLKNKSIDYVSKISSLIEKSGKIVKNSSIKSIKRINNSIKVNRANGLEEEFDKIIFACHPSIILKLLDDVSKVEKDCLNKFSRQKNIIYTHSDHRFMPKIKKCWSSWNYLYERQKEKTKPNLSVTYWMNRLQHIGDSNPLFVTLNPNHEVEHNKIYDVHEFYHPVFDHKAIIAQAEIDQIQGLSNTWYCGAYLRYGFHEDGIWSAKKIVKKIHGK